MADSEKKKRLSKEAKPVKESEVATSEPVDDSAAKSKRKSKKSVSEPVESKPEAVEVAVEAQTEGTAVSTKEGDSEPSGDDAVVKSKRKSKKHIDVVAKEEVTKAEEAIESEEGQKEEIAPVVSKDGDSGVPGDDSAVKAKRKSKKTVQESTDTHVEAEKVPVEEKTSPTTENDSIASDAKPKKQSGVKSPSKSEDKPSDAVSAQDGNPNKSSTPKRRQSMVGKFFDKILGKGDSKDKHKEKEKPKETVAEPAPSKAAEKVEDEPVQSEAPRKKKKRESKATPVEVAPEEGVEVGEDEEAYEYQEEEAVEEEAPKLALPRMPPPSAPKKAPAGPVKQGPDVSSVFSMKPQIKVEVGEVEIATEYDAEDVKREVDFRAFCEAKPQYTVGDELAGTAYNREWSAESTQSPHHVLIKFYSNEPPRLIGDSRIQSHLSLVQSLVSNVHILPVLDDFVGDAFVDVVKAKGKESASSSEQLEPEFVEPVVVVEHAAPGTEGSEKKKKASKKEDPEEVAEKEPAPTSSKKKKKGSKISEETTDVGTTTRPEPKVAAPPVESSEKEVSKAKTEEHDRYLVLERLPDVVHFALSVGASFSESHVAKIVSGVLNALESVHAAGYMHRAIVPTNVVVNEAGEARLTGFDMASKIDSPEGVVMTSEKFKAPEITHSATHNQTVDLWGVGVLTYFLLTGRQIFRETNNARLKIAIREVNVAYDAQDWDSISPEAKAFCQALIVKDPAARLTLEQAGNHAWITTPPQTLLPSAISNLSA